MSEPLSMLWMCSMGGLERSLPPEVHVVGFGKTQKLEGHHLSFTRTDRENAQPNENTVRAVAGEELGEPLLMPWMPSKGGLAGSLPPDVHVVGFGKTASVFSSKQKPKELTIYGSDFRCRHSHCHKPVWHSPS